MGIVPACIDQLSISAKQFGFFLAIRDVTLVENPRGSSPLDPELHPLGAYLAKRDLEMSNSCLRGSDLRALG